MPVTGWHAQAIRRLFSGTLPGDWGDEGDPDTGVAVLRSTNFRDDGSIDYGDLAFRSIAAARLEKRGIHRGTILIEKAGGSSTRQAGRVVYCDRDFDGTASNFVEIVRVAQQFVPQHVFYLLYWNYHAGRVQKYQQQTTGIINFKLCEYSDEEVLVPAKTAEQSKIAEVLSTVDRAIKRTETLIAKQQRIKTGLMQDLLTRGIDEHGNLRSEKTHKFKDSPLGRIPVEWDAMSLGSCGQWFSGGTPPKAIGRFWGGGVPWICPKDMKQFELHQSIDTITADAVRAGTRLMPTGTVFIVVRGMILAHTFPVGVSTTDVAFNQDVKAIIPKQRLMGRYLAYWLSSNSHQFLKLATTATHGTKRFDMDELQAVSIGAPMLNEQRLIVSKFDEQQSIIERLQSLTAKLQAEKRGLMQDLLTGDRRVTALLEQGEGATA